MKIENCKLKIAKQGFTLIELLVAIFIFSLITVGIVSVFVSSTSAHQKARAIKNVKENIEFAMSSIAKDVRMGNIDKTSIYSDGTYNSNLKIRRNRGGSICYTVGATTLAACDEDCSSSCEAIVDLSDTEMEFDITDSKSGFYSCPTDVSASPTACPSGATAEKHRGWVEINLNVKMASGAEMEADQINVQTIVSSRDYGWEEVGN